MQFSKAKPDPETRRSTRGKALRNRRKPRKIIPARLSPSFAVSEQPSPPDETLPAARVETAAAEESFSLPETGSPAAARIAERKRGKRFWLVQAGVLALLAVLGLLLYLGRKNASYTVSYVVPGSSDLTETYLYGESAKLHEPVPAEGKTFLCWEDARGVAEKRDVFPVYSNRTLTARYLPAFDLKEHIAYLDTGENGLLNPGGSITIRDYVLALYKLLNTGETGRGTFLDVPEDDACYDAAAYLKDLGILSGKRLHPDDWLTRGEMLKTLSAFYPQTEETFVFQDLDAGSPLYPYFCTAAANGWIASGSLVHANADETVTRGSFARVMNRVLHRNGERHLTNRQTGTVLDVIPGGEYYDDMIEAAIPHSYRMEHGEEIWTDSKPLPIHEPGFFFSGVRLHCIAEDGNPVVNTALGGLMFNANGEITTGDAELDRQLWEILENTVDPGTMTREEMLRAAYDHVIANYTYIYGRMYAFGAEGWAIKETKRMLADHGGNCYCYAALFYELARFLGYDAQIYSGRVSGEQYDFRDYEGNIVYAGENSTPHAWVEIEIAGENYLFDTEYEFRSYGGNKMFKRNGTIWQQFGYSKPKPASESASP